MFLGPLLHSYDDFQLPYAGGCDLGARTIEPHLQVLRRFGLEVLPTDGFYNAGRPGRRADPADHPDRARRHGHRERAAGRRPLPRRDRAAQRQPELHGPGPVRLPHPSGRGDRRHRHHHPAHPRRPADRHRRGVRTVGGPDRGDEPADRGDRDRVRGGDPAGADRVPGDRARDPGGDGARLLPGRRVRGRERSHPAGRPHRPAVGAEVADRQDPPDAVPRPQHRQPAVLRGDRGHRRRARPSSTTGCTRTGPST